MSKESEANLPPLVNKLEGLLKKIAEPEIKNESIDYYLGFIGKGYEQYWDELLKYTVYSHKTLPLGKPGKPELSRHELNYNGICRLYGKKEVQAIMTRLASDLAKNGGDNVYYELANSRDDCAGTFLALAQYVSQYERSSDTTSFSKPMVQLQTYYHEKADQYIKEQWQKTQWPIGHEYLANELDETMVRIIKARAFAEFCRQTSSYFFGLYPVPRELCNGVLDVPRGMWHTVRHPIDTVNGIGGFFTKEGWTNIGNSVVHHPVRVLTSAVISGACSYGVGHLSSVLAPAAHAPSHFLPGAIAAKTSGVLSAKAAAMSVPAVTVPNLISEAAIQGASPIADKREPDEESSTDVTPIHVTYDDWSELLNRLITHDKHIDNEEKAYMLLHEWSQELQKQKQAESLPIGTLQRPYIYRFFAATPLTASVETSPEQPNTPNVR